LQFAQPSLLKIAMGFVPNEQLASVLSRETIGNAISMLPGSLDKVGRASNVNRPVAPTCHDVDETALHGGSMAGLSLKR
jgi:hypothetical protein